MVNASVGHALTQAPHPTQCWSSISGFPLKFSGTSHGTAGNFVVNLGEKMTVTASFSSLSLGLRNFKLLFYI